MFDATFKFIKDGDTAEISYQDIIKKLDCGDVIIEGFPLTEGGTPQMMMVKQLFESRTPGLNIEVYFKGNLIL